MVCPKKGEIYLVNFDPTIGHEVKKKRPALIISNDIHNQHSPLVTVAPLFSNVDKIYPFEISCDSYPGITSDMKSLFTVLGLKIKGRSEIIDLRYPKRNKYIDELLKMKAVIGEVLNSNYRLAIYGGNKLIGTEVEATDLRGGVALLLAGLIAEGETIIHNANQIYRGYEHIDKKLKNLGANIELIEE